MSPKETQFFDRCKLDDVTLKLDFWLNFAVNEKYKLLVGMRLRNHHGQTPDAARLIGPVVEQVVLFLRTEWDQIQLTAGNFLASGFFNYKERLRAGAGKIICRPCPDVF